jgi:hypothetical protein
MRVFGLEHPDVKAFIQKEDIDCKRWNQFARRANSTVNASLKYHRNRYTGRIPFD